MTVFWGVLGFVGALLVIALAAVGLLALAYLAFGDEDQHQRNQTRATERQIAELGRQAQAAILNEAVRRVHRSGGEPSAGQYQRGAGR